MSKNIPSANFRVAVIGGGQTAGQLALHAAQRDACVTLIRRGMPRIADLDVDAGWLMDDHLEPFAAIDDPIARRAVVEAAQIGSMTSDLDAALRASSVTVVSGAEEITATNVGGGARIGFAGVECVVDRVWSATGSVPDLRASPPLAAIARAGAPHVDGWPVLDADLEWCDGLHIVGALDRTRRREPGRRPSCGDTTGRSGSACSVPPFRGRTRRWEPFSPAASLAGCVNVCL